MHEQTSKLVSSVIRWALGLLGAYLVGSNYQFTHGLGELDWANGTLVTIISGVVLALISLLLKKASELGGNGRLVALFIGPRVVHLSASITRWVLTLAAGLFIGYEQANPEVLGNSDLPSLITLALSLLTDRIYKHYKP